MLTAATQWLFDVSNTYIAQSIGLYVGLAALVLRSVPNEPAERGLGPANRVTLARSTLVLPVAALALDPSNLAGLVWWWVIAVSTIAMVGDSIDGSIARRTGTTTAFGARFDMELDSFLVIALSILVWRSGKVGPWILLIGVFRYLFVIAGWLWPAMTAELPASQRRKVVCVVNGVVLLVCLGPIIPSSVAFPAAVTALLLLTWSFAVDIQWLAIQATQKKRNT
jgi:phosphatidylglycerophosphate synthase